MTLLVTPLSYESILCEVKNENVDGLLEKINKKIVFNNEYNMYFLLAKKQRMQVNQGSQLHNQLAIDSQALIKKSITNYLKGSENCLHALIKNQFFINFEELRKYAFEVLLDPHFEGAPPEKEQSLQFVKLIKHYNIVLPQNCIFELSYLSKTKLNMLLNLLPINVHYKNEEGQNVLHYLANAKNFFYYGPNSICQKMKVLMRHGLKLTEKDNGGLNSIHWVMKSSNIINSNKVLHFIFDRKDLTDLYAITNDGKSYEDLTENKKALKLLAFKKAEFEKKKLDNALKKELPITIIKKIKI